MNKNLILLALALIISVSIFAADVEVNLNGNTADKTFEVKDNASPTNTLFKVDGTGNVNLKANSHLNFSSTAGSSGYGFRDNSGTLEYKNSGGSWNPWVVAPTNPYSYASSAYSYGEISYNHGNYGTTQPTVTIGSATAYTSMLPCTLGSGGGTPYITVANGDVQVINAPSTTLPAYLKINAAGTYKISASVAIKSNNSSSVEVEIFRQNLASVPTLASWATGTHDIESMSTAFMNTNNELASGSVSGILDCAANDYIALCSRVLSGNSNTHQVICINLNIQRIK